MAEMQKSESWLTRKQAALFLNSIGYPITWMTLAKLPWDRSPPYNRMGHRKVRYHKDDLTAWARRNTKRVGIEVNA